ncbi:MAG: hypothetical protein KC591_17705 [Gemmatimonadetes bacterium]|nr:hypothetical protein [Gemmatimonadota bacterium]
MSSLRREVRSLCLFVLLAFVAVPATASQDSPVSLPPEELPPSVAAYPDPAALRAFQDLRPAPEAALPELNPLQLSKLERARTAIEAARRSGELAAFRAPSPEPPPGPPLSLEEIEARKLELWRRTPTPAYDPETDSPSAAALSGATSR